MKELILLAVMSLLFVGAVVFCTLNIVIELLSLIVVGYTERTDIISIDDQMKLPNDWQQRLYLLTA